MVIKCRNDDSVRQPVSRWTISEESRRIPPYTNTINALSSTIINKRADLKLREDYGIQVSKFLNLNLNSCRPARSRGVESIKEGGPPGKEAQQALEVTAHIVWA